MTQEKFDFLLQVVGMIMQTTFGDLDDKVVDEDPLIKLPCGHVFTTSTLDGMYRHACRQTSSFHYFQ